MRAAEEPRPVASGPPSSGGSRPGQWARIRAERGGAAPFGQRRPGAGLALLLGALILGLALPRVLASAVLALRDPVIQQMDAGQAVSDAALRGLIASRELALGWVEDRETRDEQGTALARLAFAEEPQSADQRALLAQAAAALRAGLALAPADPKGWMQLAYLLALLEGDPNRDAARALLFSIRTGAFQAPAFLNRRLFWALAHWTFYDEEERRRIGDQIRLVWNLAPDDLTELALRVPEFRAPIVTALEQVPGARAQLGAALAAPAPTGD